MSEKGEQLPNKQPIATRRDFQFRSKSANSQISDFQFSLLLDLTQVESSVYYPGDNKLGLRRLLQFKHQTLENDKYIQAEYFCNRGSY